MIDLAEEQGIPLRLDMFGAEVLMTAEEVFITSTAGGVMPVTTVNGRKIGDGKPGKITTLIQKRYWEIHDEGPWVTLVDYPDQE
jgi:branched-chain amino acid aminotransferase